MKRMTVGDLIKKLSKYKKDTPIVFLGREVKLGVKITLENTCFFKYRCKAVFLEGK